MHINVIQAILIGFLYFLCQSGTPWLTAFMGNYVRQPLVNGAIVGLIMGDPVQGLIIGSAINLPFIGVIMVCRYRGHSSGSCQWCFSGGCSIHGGTDRSFGKSALDGTHDEKLYLCSHDG